MAVYDLQYWAPILTDLDELDERITRLERGLHALADAITDQLRELRAQHQVLDDLRAHTRALGEAHAELRLAQHQDPRAQ